MEIMSEYLTELTDIKILNRILFLDSKDCIVYKSCYLVNRKFIIDELLFVRKRYGDSFAAFFTPFYFDNHVKNTIKPHKFNYYANRFKSKMFDFGTVFKRLS